MGIRSKQDLAVVLSRLEGFKEPSWELEQYPTPSELAADWLWHMALKGEISGKVIADLACGPGILGIGALLMGAKNVFFVDKDTETMQTCRRNISLIQEGYEIGSFDFVVGNVEVFDHQVDVVIQNPPFGTREKHIDKLFLEKAFEVGGVVWSMHKRTTRAFVEAISSDHGFKITDYYEYDFPIKAVFKFHEKPVLSVEVGLWRLEKKT